MSIKLAVSVKDLEIISAALHGYVPPLHKASPAMVENILTLRTAVDFVLHQETTGGNYLEYANEESA